MMIRLQSLIAGVAFVATAGPGLPADFPLAPHLAACKPIVSGPEIICDWHDVADGHAVFTFYMQALPKAGYTILPGAAETSSPTERGVIAFKKGGIQGAITIAGADVSIQVLYPQSG
jgi:hypothetical protein